MNVRIRTRGIPLTSELRAGVELRLSYALGRFARLWRTADVALEDVNANKGGVDKVCRIRLLGIRGDDLAAEAMDSETLRALDAAAARLSRAAARRAGQLRSFPPQSFSGVEEEPRNSPRTGES